MLKQKKEIYRANCYKRPNCFKSWQLLQIILNNKHLLTVEINNNSSFGISFRLGSLDRFGPREKRSVVKEALLLFLGTKYNSSSISCWCGRRFGFWILITWLLFKLQNLLEKFIILNLCQLLVRLKGQHLINMNSLG